MPDYPASLGRMLNFASGATNQMCNGILADHGLTLPQWVILSALWREDGMLVSEIAHYTTSALPAASRIIDRMETAGLVSRTIDPADRRAVRVHVTEKARQLAHLSLFFEDVNDRLLVGFSEAEATALFAMLQRVTENARMTQTASYSVSSLT